MYLVARAERRAVYDLPLSKSPSLARQVSWIPHHQIDHLLDLMRSMSHITYLVVTTAGDLFQLISGLRFR